MEEEFNPYAAPRSATPAGSADAKYLRLAHLGVESNLKALGVLWLWMGLWVLLAAVIHAMVLEGAHVPSMLSAAFPAAVPPIVVGAGLWRLRRWGWGLCVIVSGLLLVTSLAFFDQGILGVIILAVMLRFLLREKTRKIVAEEYPGIMAATPELHSPVAKWGWWVCGILTLLASVNYFRFFFEW